MQEFNEAPEEQRFNRLKNLLDKSNVYAQFLLKRMDQQREADKQKREQKQKVQGKRAQTHSKKKETSQALAESSQESSEVCMAWFGFLNLDEFTLRSLLPCVLGSTLI